MSEEKPPDTLWLVMFYPELNTYDKHNLIIDGRIDTDKIKLIDFLKCHHVVLWASGKYLDEIGAAFRGIPLPGLFCAFRAFSWYGDIARTIAMNLSNMWTYKKEFPE